MTKINKYFKRSGFILCLCVCCIGCSSPIKKISYQPPIFEKQQQVNLEVINDSFLFRSITYMAIYDSLLIVCDPFIHPIITIFNKNDGSFLKSTGIVGHGPGELVTPVRFSLDYTKGILYVYDDGKRALISYSLQDVMNDSKIIGTETKITNPVNLKHASFLRDSLYLAAGGLQTAVTVCKMDDSEIKATLIPDNPLEMETNEWLGFLGIWSMDAVSPDGNKYVIATTLGEIMYSYLIHEDSIQLNAVKYFYKPVYDMKRSIIYLNDETLFGFTALCATNDYIYAADHAKVNPTELPREIHQFDWNGNPINTYNCNYNINTFAVDEIAHQIYVAVYKEGELAIARGNFNMENI
jgi:hypothetical protein